MIPIKIGEKKYNIKVISELTTAEFIELSKIEKPDVLKYVAWQTGVTNEKAFFAIIDPIVEKAIGTVPDITKMKMSKFFDKKKLIETVGQRHQIEGSGLTGYELLVLTLAVAQARSNNYEDVEKLRKKYMNMPFAEVLPAGFFFFKTYRTGKKSVRSYLNLILALIKIRSLKKVQGLKG